MSRMRNLTLASAKHLLSQGHITQAHHNSIVKAAGAPTMPKMPTMPQAPAGAFGALAKPKKPKAVAMPMQQAQTPIPGIGNQPPTDPYSILGGGNGS